jgi:hypothetical protein
MSAEWRQESCSRQLCSKLLRDPDHMQSGGHGGRVRMRGDGYSDQDTCVMQDRCVDKHSGAQIEHGVGLCHPVLVSYHPYTRATSSDHRPQCAFNIKLLSPMHSQHSYVVTERKIYSAPSHSSF